MWKVVLKSAVYLILAYSFIFFLCIKLQTLCGTYTFLGSIVTKNRINKPDFGFLISQHTKVLYKIHNKKKRLTEFHCALYSSLAWI